MKGPGYRGGGIVKGFGVPGYRGGPGEGAAEKGRGRGRRGGRLG